MAVEQSHAEHALGANAHQNDGGGQEKRGRQRQIKGGLKKKEHCVKTELEKTEPPQGRSVFLLLRDGKQLVSVKVAAIKKHTNRGVIHALHRQHLDRLQEADRLTRTSPVG